MCGARAVLRSTVPAVLSIALRAAGSARIKQVAHPAPACGFHSSCMGRMRWTTRSGLAPAGLRAAD